MVREEREKEINEEDEMREKGRNPVLISEQQKANSGSKDRWLRLNRETGQAARLTKPPKRMVPTAQAVGSRELLFKMQNFQPEGALRLDFLVRLEWFSEAFRTSN